MTLWDKVESAMVGGLDDALRTYVREIATGNYPADECRDVAEELQKALEEHDALKKQYG
jgi:hypothetical protein